MSQEQWNSGMRIANYDEAWSLVQFLYHGDDGRHRDGLLEYLRQTSRGRDPVSSFRECLGDIDVYDMKWQQYVRGLSKVDTSRAYGQVAVQTVCSFLARSAIVRQNVSSLDQLVELAKSGQLQQPHDNGLPVDLLMECLDWAKDMGQWELDLYGTRKKANVILRLNSGGTALSRYALDGAKVQSVKGWIEETNHPTNGRH
jgi:hypothetical protein